MREDSRAGAFVRENGLSITIFTLFALFLAGQVFTGSSVFNEDSENTESEFLQMAFYVMLTAFLFQKGSSESKNPGQEEGVDRDPRSSKNTENAPWPVRKGGWLLAIYEYSLTLAFLLLFLASFTWHAIGESREYSQKEVADGGEAVTAAEYLGTPQCWFESFQNWQSEFVALGAMVVLSIFLRQRGSPESKPVAAANSETA